MMKLKKPNSGELQTNDDGKFNSKIRSKVRIGKLPCADGMSMLLRMHAHLILHTQPMDANAAPASLQNLCKRILFSMIPRSPRALDLISQSKAPIQDPPYDAKRNTSVTAQLEK